MVVVEPTPPAPLAAAVTRPNESTVMFEFVYEPAELVVAKLIAPVEVEKIIGEVPEIAVRGIYKFGLPEG